MQSTGRAVVMGALKTALVAGICIGPSLAARAATATGTAQLVVVAPFTVVKTADLVFGNLIASATSSTVTINPNTLARTTTGGIIGASGAFHPAEFVTQGEPNRRVNIRLPNGSTLLTRVGGGATMTVTNFTRNGAPPNSTPLDATGLLTFRVGGQLNVAANQMPGSYVGSFTVEVQYQ